MDNDLNVMVLSAMIHDIGKLAQRARRPRTEGMEGDYLTHQGKGYGHWHTLYTDYFIEKDLPIQRDLETQRSRIARLASAHHRPDSSDMAESSLMIADRLSSGTDRIATEESDTGFRESRLVSVFDEIEMVRHTFTPPGNAFYDLRPLEAGTDAIFPRSGRPEGKADDYKTLFDAFATELAKLRTDLAFPLYLDGLISLLERYTWCVPSSSYKTLSDISLFDHAVSTAGIAQALFLYHRSNGGIPGWEDDAEKIILVGGDLSGIQDYIFGISRNSGRGASKIFRARSFYLQAVMRSVVLAIQDRLGLTAVCRFVDTGGKFILLAPALEETVQRLESLDEELQTWFRRKFKGLLTLSLAYSTRLRQADFLDDRFRSKVDAVNAAIEAAKLRKLDQTFAGQGPALTEEYDEREGNNCQLCGINAGDPAAGKRYQNAERLDIAICADCCDQIKEIGTLLPRTRFLLFGERGETPLFGDLKLSLRTDEPTDLNGMRLVETFEDGPNYRRARLARHLPMISAEELADPNWYNLFVRELEKDVFPEADKPKTFSMIAHKSKKPGKENDLVGRSLLAFFKADVDNLGLLFSLGLEERMSAARYTSVSRMLDLFFSEHLVEMAKRDYPDIYVVFAGGDDLFLVGPWWQTVSFAIELRKELSRFCANNPDITLSGSIFLAKPRMPMRKAAELVESHLETAKETKSKGRIKDSVAFMEEVFGWDTLEALIRDGHWFDDAVERHKETGFSTAFLYRLLIYHHMYREFMGEKKIASGRYLALAHYDIGRNIDTGRLKNEKEVQRLRDIFVVGVDERPELDHLNVPLFYAMNRNRKTE